MKYLIVLVLVLVAVWIWRNNRRSEKRPPASRGPQKRPAHMVACDRCGMHLPAEEAVRGERGIYCGPEHRKLTEEASG